MPKRGRWEPGVTASENDPFPLQGHTDKRQRTHSRKAHRETRTALSGSEEPYHPGLGKPFCRTELRSLILVNGDAALNLVTGFITSYPSSGHKYSRGSPFLVPREQVSHPSCLLPSQAFIQDSFWVDLRLFHSERERLPHCKKSSL